MKKTYKDVDASLLNAIPNPDKKTYEIKIKQNNNIINEGIFLGINADGSLNLKMKNNEEMKYEHGEISIEGIY